MSSNVNNISGFRSNESMLRQLAALKNSHENAIKVREATRTSLAELEAGLAALPDSITDPIQQGRVNRLSQVAVFIAQTLSNQENAVQEMEGVIADLETVINEEIQIRNFAGSLLTAIATIYVRAFSIPS